MKNLGKLDVGLKCLPNTEAGNMKCMNKTLILGERESIKNMARDVWLVPRKRNIAFGISLPNVMILSPEFESFRESRGVHIATIPTSLLRDITVWTRRNKLHRI